MKVRNVIANRMFLLGLSCPCEDLLKRATAVLIVTSQSGHRVEPSEYVKYAKLIKTTIKANDMNAKYKYPFDHMETYPVNPNDLPSAIYRHAYADGFGPSDIPAGVAGKIDALMPDMMYRTSHKKLRTQPPTAQLPQFQQFPMQQVQEMVSAGFQQMAAAMGFQMPGHGGVNIDILRPPNSVSAGANGNRLMLNGGLPNLAVAPAAQQRSGMPALPPSPLGAPLTDASSPTADSSPGVAGSPIVGTTAEAGDVGGGGIEEFEAKMVAAASSAKAKAKAKAAAAKAEAAAETPKAKAKAKAKTSPKCKGAGTTKANGAKAKGTGSASSKGGNWACKKAAMRIDLQEDSMMMRSK
eukprot:7810668-Pyramimonas_sp.AAC.1